VGDVVGGVVDRMGSAGEAVDGEGRLDVRDADETVYRSDKKVSKSRFKMFDKLRPCEVGSLPFSHLLRCLLPSLPFCIASRFLRLSLAEGGRRGTSTVSPLRSVTLRSSVFAAVGVLVRRTLTSPSSSGIDSGVPVPRATGEIERDCSADTVHASISTPAGLPVVVAAFGIDAAGGSTCDWRLLVSSGGGGTALYLAIGLSWVRGAGFVSSRRREVTRELVGKAVLLLCNSREIDEFRFD
jgi:hypothetical protein